MTQQRGLGFVDVDRQPHDHGNQRAWHDVDQKQPVPGKRVGQEAAERRPQGPCQAEDHRDDRDDRRQVPAAKPAVHDRPDDRSDGAAAKPLHRAIEDHLAEAGRGGAQHAGAGKAERRDDEENAGREDARQHPRHRHHHDIGDEIGGLHPGDFVGASRQPALDLGQRAGDNLYVHDRHELAGAHGEDADPITQPRRRFGGSGRAQLRRRGRREPLSGGRFAPSQRNPGPAAAPQRAGEGHRRSSGFNKGAAAGDGYGDTIAHPRGAVSSKKREAALS